MLSEKFSTVYTLYISFLWKFQVAVTHQTSTKIWYHFWISKKVPKINLSFKPTGIYFFLET